MDLLAFIIDLPLTSAMLGLVIFVTFQPTLILFINGSLTAKTSEEEHSDIYEFVVLEILDRRSCSEVFRSAILVTASRFILWSYWYLQTAIIYGTNQRSNLSPNGSRPTTVKKGEKFDNGSGGFQIYSEQSKKGLGCVFDAYIGKGDRLRFKTDGNLMKSKKLQRTTDECGIVQNVEYVNIHSFSVEDDGSTKMYQRFENSTLLVEWHEARRGYPLEIPMWKWDEIFPGFILVFATTQKRLEIVCCHGTPASIESDRDPKFKRLVLKRITESVGELVISSVPAFHLSNRWSSQIGPFKLCKKVLRAVWLWNGPKECPELMRITNEKWMLAEGEAERGYDRAEEFMLISIDVT
ncbi:hypothetical protein Tco_0123564 [Tanacetum coccineum]